MAAYERMNLSGKQRPHLNGLAVSGPLRSAAPHPSCEVRAGGDQVAVGQEGDVPDAAWVFDDLQAGAIGTPHTRCVVLTCRGNCAVCRPRSAVEKFTMNNIVAINEEFAMMIPMLAIFRRL